MPASDTQVLKSYCCFVTTDTSPANVQLHENTSVDSPPSFSNENALENIVCLESSYLFRPLYGNDFCITLKVSFLNNHWHNHNYADTVSHLHSTYYYEIISPIHFTTEVKDRAHLSTFKFFIFEKFSCFIVLVVFLVIVQSSELISEWFCEKNDI